MGSDSAYKYSGQSANSNITDRTHTSIEAMPSITKGPCLENVSRTDQEESQDGAHTILAPIVVNGDDIASEDEADLVDVSGCGWCCCVPK